MVYSKLEPKSSHITKYSQPLELVPFLVIIPRINYYKDPNTCIYIK